MCKECVESVFESQCCGLNLHRDDGCVIIDPDSCYNGSFKVVYRKQKLFPDKTFLNYDEVLICADKRLLIKIADSIKKEFD